MSASAWIGARERCASATMATMRASVVSAPVRSTRMSKLPVPLSVPPVTRSPAAFSTGSGSPVRSDFVDGAAAFEHDAVDRHLVAGRTRRTSPTATSASGTSSVVPSGGDPQRRLRREVEQGADGAAGPLAGAQLQDLAEEDQGRDHGRRLEVERHEPVASRIAAGRRRARDGDDAVEERRAGAERDQREHVEVAGGGATPSRARRTASRTRAPPESRARAGDIAGARREEGQEVDPEEMLRHVEDEEDERERHGDAEAPGHVDQLGIVVPRPVATIGSSAMPQIGQLPGRRGRSADASGRCRACPAAAASPRPSWSNSARGPLRTWYGSRQSRTNRSRRDARSSARARRYRPSSRIRGRWPYARRSRSSRLCRGASRMGSS